MNPLRVAALLAALWSLWQLRSLALPLWELLRTRWLPASRWQLPAALTNPADDTLAAAWALYRARAGDTPASRARFEADVLSALLTLLHQTPAAALPTTTDPALLASHEVPHA